MAFVYGLLIGIALAMCLGLRFSVRVVVFGTVRDQPPGSRVCQWIVNGRAQ